MSESAQQVLKKEGNRRDFLKKSAAAGAIAWAAPAVSTLSRAAAQNGTPMPGECECDTAACALRITGQVNLEACGTPGGVPLTGFVSASLLTATTETASGENDACDASASVADLNISLGDPLPDITATLLSSSVSAPCDCGTPTTSGEVVGLMIGGTQVTSDTQITVDTLTLVVALNEVICGEDGRITRRALRIEAVSEAPVFTIIAGESAARAASCPECSA